MTPRIGLPCILLPILLLTFACHSASSTSSSGIPQPSAGGEETAASGEAGTANERPDLLRHEVIGIDGQPLDMEAFRGQVLLLVNTASECGFTRQYEDLQEIHERFGDRGFSVIGFPCNDFGGQEPGTEEEIAAFCTGEFGVTFPMSARVQITEDPHPLWRDLQENTGDGIDGPVRWNFTKFLVDHNGHAIERWPSRVRPNGNQIVSAIEAALQERGE